MFDVILLQRNDEGHYSGKDLCHGAVWVVHIFLLVFFVK